MQSTEQRIARHGRGETDFFPWNTVQDCIEELSTILHPSQKISPCTAITGQRIQAGNAMKENHL